MDFASIEKMIKINLSVVIQTSAANQRGFITQVVRPTTEGLTNLGTFATQQWHREEEPKLFRHIVVPISRTLRR